MLELAGGIAFGVDIGDFLELERAFEGQRITGAAAEIEHVLVFGQVTRQGFDLRLDGIENAAHQARHFRQAPDQLLLLPVRERATCLAGGRSEERRVGKACVSEWRYRRAPEY